MQGLAAFVTIVDALPPGVWWDRSTRTGTDEGLGPVRVTRESYLLIVSALKALGFNPLSCRSEEELDQWLAILGSARVDGLVLKR